jgi:hypothetical protein
LTYRSALSALTGGGNTIRTQRKGDESVHAYEMRGFIWRWAALTVFVIALILLAPIGCNAIMDMIVGNTNPFDPYPSWTLEKVETLIQSELALGCKRQQVEDWCDRHNIRHHYLQDTTWHKDGANTMPTLAGLHDGDLSGMTHAEVVARGYPHGIDAGNRGSVQPQHDEPKANFQTLGTGRVDIFFFFDTEGRYVGHRARPLILMP